MATDLGNFVRHPLVLLAVTFVVTWASARAGSSAFLRRRHGLNETLREDFGLILASALTLLGLIIGFSFSMATGRYDQRKNYEEAEANAIGTEYVRADLLPAPDAARVRALLRTYLDLRIQFYEERDDRAVRRIDAQTADLQAQLWAAVLAPSKGQPTPLNALVVAGMNDVLNSQGYTQAAWSYRIPAAAWGLMLVIAVGCNALVGYGSHGRGGGGGLLLILPLLLSIAFMFIADIDTPRHGLIRVKPVNLLTLANSLPPG